MLNNAFESWLVCFQLVSLFVLIACLVVWKFYIHYSCHKIWAYILLNNAFRELARVLSTDSIFIQGLAPSSLGHADDGLWRCCKSHNKQTNHYFWKQTNVEAWIWYFPIWLWSVSTFSYVTDCANLYFIGSEEFDVTHPPLHWETTRNRRVLSQALHPFPPPPCFPPYWVGFVFKPFFLLFSTIQSCSRITLGLSVGLDWNPFHLKYCIPPLSFASSIFRSQSLEFSPLDWIGLVICCEQSFPTFGIDGIDLNTGLCSIQFKKPIRLYYLLLFFSHSSMFWITV